MSARATTPGTAPARAAVGAAPDGTDGLVELVVEDAGWSDSLPGLAPLAETAAHAALRGAERDAAGWSVCLLACSDARIAGLNADFRGRAAPTNVLSWPAFDPVPGDPSPGQTPRLHLGDVALARETCVREASDAGIPLKAHATHLILHGVLHLLGYDHVDEVDADQMERIESHAMRRLGYPDPYQRGDAPGAHSIE